MRPRGVNRPQGFAQAAAFHQFDHHAVYGAGVTRDIGGVMDAFIGENRQADAALTQFLLQPAVGFHVHGRERLLDEFQPVARQARNQVARLFGRPAAVGIHPQTGIGGGADGGHRAFRLFRAEFHLEIRVSALAGGFGHHFGAVRARVKEVGGSGAGESPNRR